MRWLLIALIVLLQYPLWLGKGGWLRVWDGTRKFEQQRESNHQLEARNAGLDAEVRDLKQGYDAIEERARLDLGMIRHDEVFVQTLDPEKKQDTDGRDADANKDGD
ncbi:MAG: cell division protein FtsB [Candidatus Accumulibacter sp.]|nr:cell division protein FtsB [Accumulibacter sp.]